MHRYWEPLIRPICDALQPSVLVEVGSATGLHTKSLLEHARDAGYHVHIIDPMPIGNAGELGDLLDHATVHRATSHEALPGLEGDVFLVDGDHNWFTVFHDLRHIEETAKAKGRPMPVLICHDVAWPYGRRDMYYAPERVPAEFRKPYARRGFVLGRSDLLPEGGVNRLHDNALQEGGERNGVLTAIEDWIAQSDVDWRLVEFPVFHGLGILWDPTSLPEGTRARLEPLLDLSSHTHRLLERVEEERLHLMTELVELHRLLGGRPGPRLAKLVRSLRTLADRLRGR